MSKKAVWLSDIEFIEMHSSDWERLESGAFEADESVQAQLNESQQIVLDWLKKEMKKKDTFPISCLWELQSWYAPKNVCRAYLTLNKEQQFELIKAWEQEEAE